MMPDKLTSIIPSRQVKLQWSDMAQAAYSANRNDIGHKFSAAASMRDGNALGPEYYSELESEWLTWKDHGTFPNL